MAGNAVFAIFGRLAVAVHGLLVGNEHLVKTRLFVNVESVALKSLVSRAETLYDHNGIIGGRAGIGALELQYPAMREVRLLEGTHGGFEARMLVLILDPGRKRSHLFFQGEDTPF